MAVRWAVYLVSAWSIALGLRCSSAPLGAAPDPLAEQATPIDTAAVAAPPPLTLVPGDQVQVRFFYYPELTTTVTVRDDGRLSLDLVDEVPVEGLTPTELDERLTELYAPHLRFPTLTVVVTEGPRQIYVGGEIQRPGMLALRPRMTVVQAVYASGSFSEEADIHRVVLLREAGRGLRTFRILDVAAIQQARTEDPRLQPFDVVWVPKSSIANLNLYIEQHVDKVLPFDRGMSFNYTEVLR